jgi:SAM-dependent methyltransferase
MIARGAALAFRNRVWFQRKKAEATPENAASPDARRPDGPVSPKRASAAMKNVNCYHRELTPEEIARGVHRGLIGGNWEEIGELQFEYLKSRGLMPAHKLCDTGCGALRGGLYFARYLDAGNYFGLDINSSLIDAGRQELEQAGLADKNANLLVSDSFEMSRFGTKFDYVVGMSLFTHLFANHIVRCLVEARKVLAPGGQYLSTFFQAPESGHLDPITHEVGGIVTYYDRDPFHYSIEEMTFLGDMAGLKTELIGKWCTRDQRMLHFSLP